MEIDAKVGILSLAIVILIILFVMYMQKSCKPVIKINSSCPVVDPGSYSNSPLGQCMLSCDRESDECYNQCNGDTECIKKCYERKTVCYSQCYHIFKDSN